MLPARAAGGPWRRPSNPQPGWLLGPSPPPCRHPPPPPPRPRRPALLSTAVVVPPLVVRAGTATAVAVLVNNRSATPKAAPGPTPQHSSRSAPTSKGEPAHTLPT